MVLRFLSVEWKWLTPTSLGGFKPITISIAPGTWETLRKSDFLFLSWVFVQELVGGVERRPYILIYGKVRGKVIFGGMLVVAAWEENRLNT